MPVNKSIVYVPILKTKAGERWALSHLKASTRRRIRPLLEFHTHKTKNVGDHIASLCDELTADWGTDRHVYFDAIWLHGDAGDPAVIATLFEEAEQRGLRAVPVVRPTFDEATLEQISDVVENCGRGYLLRVRPREQASSIERVLELIGKPPNVVDLLVDYRGRGMSLASDIPLIPHLGSWRRLVAASGVFPKSLATVPIGEWLPVPRTCWTTYQVGVAKQSNAVLFSDYLMRDPGAPPDFGIPSVNLRYTSNEHWLVRVGGKVSEGASEEIHEVCASLVGMSEFCGSAFSAGDSEIERVADVDEGTGNATQWVQWCANHHIEFAVNQIAGDE